VHPQRLDQKEGKFMSDAKSNDFIVRLDGLHLDAAAHNRIAGAIQAAVVSELGRVDLSGIKPPPPTFAYIPLKWRGIWLRDVEGLKNIGELTGPQLGVVERG
jgi:hypothetical protein